MISLPASQEQLKLIQLAMKAAPVFPKPEPSVSRDLTLLTEEEIQAFQSLGCESLLFVAEEKYASFGELYDQIWHRMKEITAPVFSEVSELGEVAAVQGLAASSQVFDGSIIGRRSDVDLFAPAALETEILEILTHHGFADVAMTEDGDLQPNTTFNANPKSEIESSPTMMKQVPFYPDPLLETYLPDVLPPIYRMPYGWVLFFGVQITKSYGSGLSYDDFKPHFLERQFDPSCGLQIPTLEAQVLISLYRAEACVRKLRKLKLTALLDALALRAHPSFEQAKFESIADRLGMKWAIAEMAALLELSKGRKPDAPGRIARELFCVDAKERCLE